MTVDGAADVDPVNGVPLTGSAAVSDGADLTAWLAARTPTPPAALRERVAALAGLPHAVGRAAAPEHLVSAAERTLRALLERDPHRRECALDLLAADALVTYGFEAAADDPSVIEPLARRAMARLSAVPGGVAEGA
jgi:hypothetical protein